VAVLWAAGGCSQEPERTCEPPCTPWPEPDGSAPPPPWCTPSDAGLAYPDDASWDPAKDSAFHQVPWADAKTCMVELAEHPRAAFPALVWGPCPSGAAGCSTRVPSWSEDDPSGFAVPSVAGALSGQRVGLWASRPDEQRAVVFDADGLPLAVWRTKPSAGTTLFEPIVTAG
jgi:hypothetical protein